MPDHMTVSGVEPIFDGKKKPVMKKHRAFPRVDAQRVADIARDVAMRKLEKNFRSING